MGEAAAAAAKAAGADMQLLDPEEFRAVAHRMVDFIADYYAAVEQHPVRSQVEPGYLKPLLPNEAPDAPEPLELVLQDVQSKIMPGITHWQSPSFFAYFPANSSTAGFLGDMLSGALNIVGFSWIGSPAATELETIVLDWLAKLLQLPPAFLSSSGTGGGVIQGTASEAVLVAMLAARERAIRRVTANGALSHAEALGKLVAYTSDQAHTCVLKACQIAAIDLRNFRVIPANSFTNYAVRPDLMAEQIAADIEAGLEPFFLYASVGSTSSTAVDPVAELGDIAQKHRLWFHVDAAYAGAAAICPEFRPYLDGLERADSFAFNAHKWLLTNFDCSVLYVKDSRSLVTALSCQAEYFKNKASDGRQVVDYKDWQVPLGRRFRALKLWLVMRLYGADKLREYLRKHVALAKHFESLVLADARFEVMAPTIFGLVCFRLKPPSEDIDNGKSLNAALEDKVNSSGRIFIIHTLLSGVYTLRMAIGAVRTEQRHVDAAWKLIQAGATELLAGSPPNAAVK